MMYAFILRCVLLLALVSSSSAKNTLPPLIFGHDGLFQITVFSDLHFGELPLIPKGPKEDRKTIQVMEKVLDLEKPDLVVLNGDLVTGEATSFKLSTRYIDKIVKPLEERNLTWASTYGEHDHTFTLSSNKLLRRERRHAGCRTQKMVHKKMAGTSNYYLPVYSENCTDPETAPCLPELLLWFFDSRGGYLYHKYSGQGAPMAQRNWVDNSVTEWFQKESRNWNKLAQRAIPALAFVHIPIKGAKSLQHEVDPHTNPGINREVPVAYQAQSWCDHNTYDIGNKECTFGGFDVTFTKALVATPGLIGLFFGHNHGNSWCRKWRSDIPGTKIRVNGLNLCFGQHTGYSGYGDWIRGGRQIVIRREELKNFTVGTHIRLENGNVVGAVVLNSTFNEDQYPATPNDKTYLDKHPGR